MLPKCTLTGSHPLTGTLLTLSLTYTHTQALQLLPVAKEIGSCPKRGWQLFNFFSTPT